MPCQKCSNTPRSWDRAGHPWEPPAAPRAGPRQPAAPSHLQRDTLALAESCHTFRMEENEKQTPNPKQPVRRPAKQAELKPGQDPSIFNQWHLCQRPLCHLHEWLLGQLYTHSTHWDTAATGEFPPCLHKKTHVCLWGFRGRASTDPLQEPL